MLTAISLTLRSQNFHWAKNVTSNITPNLPAGSHSICLDNSGCCYVTGTFEGLADFDPGPAVFNLYGDFQDIFVLKLDSAGNLLWIKSMGSTYEDVGRSIKWDSAGAVYITGE